MDARSRSYFAHNPDPVLAAASATAGAVALDLALNPKDANLQPGPVPIGGGVRGISPDAVQILPDLPGQAWFGFQLGNLGQRLSDTLSAGIDPGLAVGHIGDPGQALRAADALGLGLGPLAGAQPALRRLASIVLGTTRAVRRFTFIPRGLPPVPPPAPAG